MKGRILFILLCFASIQAFAQPAIADTTRVSLFDRGNKWSASLLDVKTYIGASGGSVATDAIWDAAGDIVQGTGANTAARLAIGTANQQLRVNAGATALEYFTPTTPTTVANDAIWDAKGDLAVGTGANTAAKLTVGTDGQALYADAGAASGLRWGTLEISPATITADQDNYSPTDWADAHIVRLSTDGGVRQITSFARTFDGDKKELLNVGDYPIAIPSEHPDGTAANRVTGDRVFIIYPNCSATLYADATSNRWRLTQSIIQNHDRPGVFYQWSPGSITAGDWGNIGIVTSGTAAAVTVGAAASGKPNYAGLGTGTTALGVCGVYFSKTNLDLTYHGDAHVSATWFCAIPTLSTDTEKFTSYWELAPTVSATAGGANNTIGIRQVNGVVSGNFEAFSINNTGTVTTLDLGVGPTAATRFLLRIELDRAFTEALFYVNGVYKGRINSGLPNAQGFGTRVLCQKSAGVSGRLVEVYNMYTSAVYPN